MFCRINLVLQKVNITKYNNGDFYTPIKYNTEMLFRRYNRPLYGVCITPQT